MPPRKAALRSFFAPALLMTALALGGCELLGSAGDERATLSTTPPVDVPPPDGLALPDSVEARYREDAARLALRYLYAQDEEAADEQVELPEPLVTSLYNALARVYEARDLPARDSVVTLYEIHTFPNPAMRSLIVAVDSTAGWVEAWRRGQRLTGQRRIDALVERYDLRLEAFYRWSWSHTAVLGTAEPLNLRALARLFDPVPGVAYAEPNGYIGGGNDITAEAGGVGGEAFWEIGYSVGYGDCPAGCIARRAWTFRVYADGDVRYLGASGSPLPSSP